MSEANQPDTGRQEFEATAEKMTHLEDDHGDVNLRYLRLPGAYVDFQTNAAWKVWQSATTAAQAKIASLEKTLHAACRQAVEDIARAEDERDDWHNRATEAQAERDAAREERDELRNQLASGIHSCSSDCQRTACVRERELAAALARVAELEKAMQAVSSLQHDYQGGCPDDLQPEARDSECAACRVLIDSASSAAGEANHELD
jgi:chromosome segregation ATPase